MINEWYMFIDDSRDRTDADFDYTSTVCVASVAEAVELLDNRGLPDGISFDYDLGNGETTATVLWHIIHGHLDGKWNIATINYAQFHDTDSKGKKQICEMWNGFIALEGTSNKKMVVVKPTAPLNHE